MEEQILKEGFRELFPDRSPPEFEVKYSSKVSRYGGTLKYFISENRIRVVFGNGLTSVSSQIKKGLFQTLLSRMMKRKGKPTLEMEVYSSFIKNLHLSIPKNKVDPELKRSFERVNERYFNGLIEMPNLSFEGKSSIRLANYDFQEDRIRVSSIFRGAPEDILDYLMYHELLHKHLKFSSSNGKNYYHTRRFRIMEKKFENSEEMERRLQEYIKSKRRSWKDLLFGRHN